MICCRILHILCRSSIILRHLLFILYRRHLARDEKMTYFCATYISKTKPAVAILPEADHDAVK